MKKTILLSALLTISSQALYAQGDETSKAQDASQQQAPAAEAAKPATDMQAPAADAQTPSADAQKPATDTQTPAPEAQKPATDMQTPAPDADKPATDDQSTAPQAAAQPQTMNCDYKIPAGTKTIDSNVVKEWAQKAAVQSFDFDFNSVDQQLSSLQACYTPQGWKGFNEAMDKSGNIKTIKDKQLKVTSQLDGETNFAQMKDNQWKVSMPIQVLYQNDKEKLTQLLNVTLTIGRKTTGELGIMQLIAVPRQNAADQSQQQNQPASQETPSKS